MYNSTSVLGGLAGRRSGDLALFFDFGGEFAFLLFLESGGGGGAGGVTEGAELFVGG